MARYSTIVLSSFAGKGAAVSSAAFDLPYLPFHHRETRSGPGGSPRSPSLPLMIITRLHIPNSGDKQQWSERQAPDTI